MQVGLSIYSLLEAMNHGMSLEDALQWTKDNGADHVEIVEFAVHPEIEGVVERIRSKTQQIGLRISGYCTPGNVLTGDPEADRKAAEALKGQIDIAHRMGAPLIRCDLSQWGRDPAENVIENYQRDLPWLIQVCRELADYAAGYFGKVADISGVVLQHGVYCVRVALMGFHNGFIGEKSTHGDTPAFPHGAAARHDADAAQWHYQTHHNAGRSAFGSDAESNTRRFSHVPPVTNGKGHWPALHCPA